MFYLKTLLYMLLALLVRVAAFAPLACLAVFPMGTWQSSLALLCPLLLIFVVLPLRFSFAEAMVRTPDDRSFRFGTAFSFRDYGEKLKQSLLHALHVLKWGLPLFAMVAAAAYWYSAMDALSALQTVTGIGKSWAEFCCKIGNVLGRLWGAEELVPAANTLMDGVGVLCALFGAAFLLWLYGAVRNSATRYIWVLANRGDRSPRTEVRRRLLGRRWGQLAVAFLNLLLWVPFLATLMMIFKNTVTGLADQMLMAFMSGGQPKLDVTSLVLPMAEAFAFLYLPLLPVRRWLTCTFAVHERTLRAGRTA